MVSRTVNRPVPTGSPTDEGSWAARPGALTAIRAVASVWPYMTRRSHPSRAPRSAQRRTRWGSSRPPAWVTWRSVGTSAVGAPLVASSSKVCGTPASEVTPAERIELHRVGSTTEASVSSTDPPTARCECSTDRP